MRPILTLALVAAFAPYATAAILVPINGKTPRDVLNNGAGWLQINQTKSAYTEVDALADDEPRAWVGTGGAESNYWVAKSTQKMWLWSVDHGIQTVDLFDLRPYYNRTYIDLQVGEAKIVDGIVTRRYIANGVPIVFGRPVPRAKYRDLGASLRSLRSWLSEKAIVMPPLKKPSLLRSCKNRRTSHQYPLLR